jgi:hypothetical protein
MEGKVIFLSLTGNASLTSSPSWIQSSMGPASWKGGRVGSTTLPLPRRRMSASALSSASAWDRKMGRSTKSQRLTSSSRRTGRTFLPTSMSNSYATACPTSASRTSNPDTLSPSAWKPSPFTIASLRSCGRRRNRSVPSQIRSYIGQSNREDGRKKFLFRLTEMALGTGGLPAAAAEPTARNSASCSVMSRHRARAVAMAAAAAAFTPINSTPNSLFFLFLPDQVESLA